MHKLPNILLRLSAGPAPDYANFVCPDFAVIRISLSEFNLVIGGQVLVTHGIKSSNILY